MKIKPGAAVVIASIALLSCCTPKAAPKEEVRLVVKTPPLYASKSPDEQISTRKFMQLAGEAFAAQYNEANVTVDVIQFPYTDEIEYISGCFGTEDAADVLMAGYFNMSSYIYGGRVVPLDDIISDELEADFNTGDLSISKVNGKTYMLPFYSLQNTLCYNKDLFRSCGLEKYIGNGFEIQNWTPGEWDSILAELSEKLPEMTYPMMMYADNNQGDTHIMTLLRSKGSSFFDSDGYFNLNTPEGIAALQWIKDGSDKGYFPDNCQNMEITDCMALFMNDQLAICMCNNSYLPDLDPEKHGLLNFPSADGKGISTAFVTGFMVFDNGNEAKLKAAKDFLSFIYSDEELLNYEREAIPSNKSVNGRSEDMILNLEEYYANSDTVINFTANNPNWQGSSTSVREIFWVHIHNLLTGDETPGECAALLDEECNRAIEEGRSGGNLHE